MGFKNAFKDHIFSFWRFFELLNEQGPCGDTNFCLKINFFPTISEKLCLK